MKYYRGLHEEISASSGGGHTLDTLFSRDYFLPLMLTIGYLILAGGLLFLFFDQLYNIAMNITTNERINGHRYFYMLDENSQFINRYSTAWTIANKTLL